MGTVVSPDGSRLFATTGRGKNVVFIDTATNQQIASVEVGDRPWGIAVSPDGKTIFTANGPSNDVSIVDVESRTVKAKVKAGNRPWGVAYKFLEVVLAACGGVFRRPIRFRHGLLRDAGLVERDRRRVVATERRCLFSGRRTQIGGHP